MADNTKIEWADATWNPLRAVTAAGKKGWHCEHVSEGCRNCYAETFNEHRLGTGLSYKPGNRYQVEHILDEKLLLAPLRRRKPTRYFLSSMTDVFGAWVPEHHLDRIFAVMALAPQHTFMVLTKRPERMRKYVASWYRRAEQNCLAYLGLPGRTDGILKIASPAAVEAYVVIDNAPRPNVWLGTSVEDQRAADERIPHLLATPAVVRFLSCEPLLGPVYLEPYLLDAWQSEDADWPKLGNVDWVIAGGESGPGARPMHPDWARSLRDQCAAAGVAFHFKQWGEWVPLEGFHGVNPEGDIGQFTPDGQWQHRAWEKGNQGMNRLGKARAGRLLDSRTHDDFPGMPSTAVAVIKPEEVPY